MNRHKFSIGILLTCFMVILLGTSGWSQTPVPQNVLWRVNVGTDRMTTNSAGERDAFPDDGQMFYVPSGCLDAKGAGLFRYYSGFDHRDALDAVIAGYTQEGMLGCPWRVGTWLPGLEPMFEAFNPTTGDYSLTVAGEKLPGYTKRASLNVMGYKRYKNDLVNLLNIKAGQLSVDSNLVAGGNIWHWTWNGLQYLDIAGYPQGMHPEMSLWADHNWGSPHAAGDDYSYFPDIAANIHGAPLMAAFNLGNVQTTLTVPLKYNVDNFGGSVDNPVVYQDLVFGKELTLNFQNNPTVARYRTYVYYPAPGNPGMDMWIPATYLRGLFTRYFTYDTVADQLTEITSQVSPCSPYSLSYEYDPTPFGGLIVSDATGSYAMGIYGVSPSAGGTMTAIVLVPRICPELGGMWENPTSETSYSHVEVLPVYEGAITQEITAFNTYFVTDKLTKVRAAMHKLYLTGVK